MPKDQNFSLYKEDRNLDITLRPKTWQEYVGQNHIKKNLEILIEAAKKRKEPIEHVLLYGSAGLGKTTLAHVISYKMNASLKITSGPAIEKIADLASILTNLSENDILFIDEVHRLNKTIEEVLYPAIENFSLDIIIGKGPSAKTIQLELPRFTLIAATTRIGLLSSPFRSRFGIIFKLDFYKTEEIEKILERSSKILNIKINEIAKKLIAKSSRKTPRVANRILKRVRDFAQVYNKNIIDENVVKQTLNLLKIDEIGLEETDRKILKTIIEKFNGGPTGIKNIAAATNEEVDTIEDIYEPYLMQIGFLERTPRGRIVTEKAYKHLNYKYLTNQQKKLL